MGNPNGASITVNETDLNWGDTATFSYTLPDHPAPKGRIGIMVDAFQTREEDGASVYVYGARGLVPEEFVLQSNFWTSGAAHCIATLYDIDMSTNKQRDLATTEFDVAA